MASLEARVFVGNTNGTISVIEHRDSGNTIADPISLPSAPGDMTSSSKNHIFVNMGSLNQTIALDPIGEAATLKKQIAVGQRPTHIVRDPEGSRIWVLNDGAPTPANPPTPDTVTGVDTIISDCNAASTGSVSVIQNHGEGDDDESNAGEVLENICIGRGHHRIAFTTSPARTFISNAFDGTFTVIDNNPASATYLTSIATIDLCDAAEETCDGDPATPNGAHPHGMVYSPVSGKLYNYNEDYRTINTIDAATFAVGPALNIPFAGAPHITPDGRFVFIRGFDTATVTGKLTVIDTANNDSITTHDLVNINAGALEFTSDGTRMYIGSAGSAARPTQRGNVVLAYDLSTLPALPSPTEILVGSTTAGRSIDILEHDGQVSHVFATNRADGTVSVIDTTTQTVIDTLQVGGTPTNLLIFPMGGDLSHD
ncbi:MAG: hypothetical protein MPW17_23060 (plasmid) [Candidatus Manganitrophus sp.]|nr:MAG: hypothetical protein MPW17_23060 [Candidatus Manganitrophus sp.]